MERLANTHVSERSRVCAILHVCATFCQLLRGRDPTLIVREWHAWRKAELEHTAHYSTVRSALSLKFGMSNWREPSLLTALAHASELCAAAAPTVACSPTATSLLMTVHQKMLTCVGMLTRGGELRRGGVLTRGSLPEDEAPE